MANTNGSPSTGNSNRSTNTMQNNASKTGRTDPFPLSPADYSTFIGQRLGLKHEYKLSLAQLAGQSQLIRAQEQQAKAQARQQGRMAVGQAYGDAASRGLLGSSVQAQGITRAQITRDQALMDINNQAMTQFGQLKQQRVSAIDAYRTGLGQLMLQKAQQQADLAMRAYGHQGSDPYGYNPNGAAGATAGGGGNYGAGGAVPAPKGAWGKTIAGDKNITQLAADIERVARGLFDVSQLEGFQGQGPITGGHHPGSHHYSPTGAIDNLVNGTAFDVNTTRGNNTQFEANKLNRLDRVIEKYYNPRQVIPNEPNLGSSGIHGHFDFDARQFKPSDVARIAKGGGADAVPSFVPSKYTPMFEKASRRTGVDARLLAAVAAHESAGSGWQKAVSPAGAVGVMQLMPQTAQGLGVDPYKAKSNIYGGALYLDRLLQTFRGNLFKALIAYNAGPGNVDSPPASSVKYADSIMQQFRTLGGHPNHVSYRRT